MLGEEAEEVEEVEEPSKELLNEDEGEDDRTKDGPVPVDDMLAVGLQLICNITIR